jgi:hypothetical protein
MIMGIACFLIAAGLLVRGIIVLTKGPALTDASGLGVSHAVGAMLPALAATIFGLLLWQVSREGAK